MKLDESPASIFLLYIHKLLTDSLDFEAVARNFASTNTRRINYFAIASSAEWEGEFPPPGPTPCVARRGSIPFSAPHLKNLLTALCNSGIMDHPSNPQWLACLLNEKVVLEKEVENEEIRKCLSILHFKISV